LGAYYLAREGIKWDASLKKAQAEEKIIAEEETIQVDA
jgi:hypothetical protein